MSEPAAPHFDTHVHLDMLAAKGIEPETALKHAAAAGLRGLISIAGSNRPGEYDETLRLAAVHQGVSVAIGVHPHAADGATPAVLEKVWRGLQQDRIVAVGEIGLDYHYRYSTLAAQRKTMIDQLRMARRMALPVIIHTREADSDTMAILQDEGVEELGGVIHCFSSGEELATTALSLGMYLSFSGILTFSGAGDIAAVATTAPEDRILTETDAPFLSPVPFRGRVNEPCRVVHVTERLAVLRDTDMNCLARQIVMNAITCFRIPPDRLWSSDVDSH